MTFYHSQDTDDHTKETSAGNNININEQKAKVRKQLREQQYKVKAKSKFVQQRTIHKQKVKGSRFELRKVFELRAKIDGIRKTDSKLFAIFNDRLDAERGYSDKELSAAMRPEDVDKNGFPTREGRDKTKAIMRAWRKKIMEDKIASVVPFAAKTNEGWLYYNMNTVDFEKVEHFGNKIIDGIRKTLREFLKIAKQSKAEKNSNNQKQIEEIEKQLLQIGDRKRKRVNRT